MIWGETREQKRARLGAEVLRPWFAWHPVTFTDGRRAWLTTVLRQRHNGIYWWVYEPCASRTQTPTPQNHGGNDGA